MSIEILSIFLIPIIVIAVLVGILAMEKEPPTKD